MNVCLPRMRVRANEWEILLTLDAELVIINCYVTMSYILWIPIQLEVRASCARKSGPTSGRLYCGQFKLLTLL